MNIIISATALKEGGALTIYNQFISHLADNVKKNHYYVFVTETMPMPVIEGVEYIIVNLRSSISRIIFDYWKCYNYCKKNHIKVDYAISLQNTCVRIYYQCKTILYYHQPLPLYEHKWNPFKSDERTPFFYKCIYPLFVKSLISGDTKVVVQTQFIKKRFVKRFNHPANNMHVLFPDVEQVDITNIKPLPLDTKYIRFIYPASGVKYKNHSVICEALGLIKREHPDIGDRIRLHLTLSDQNCPLHIKKIIAHNSIHSNICFEGGMSHERLLQLYKAMNGLLFPSTIETLGLPLLEAAKFGLPIIVSDLDYSKEVIGNYSGCHFVKSNDVQEWAKAILSMCQFPHKQFSPIIDSGESSWIDFFRLIK